MKWNFLAGLIKNSDNSNLTKTQQKNAMNIVDKNGTRMQRIIQSDVCRKYVARNIKLVNDFQALVDKKLWWQTDWSVKEKNSNADH